MVADRVDAELQLCGKVCGGRWCGERAQEGLLETFSDLAGETIAPSCPAIRRCGRGTVVLALATAAPALTTNLGIVWVLTFAGGLASVLWGVTSRLHPTTAADRDDRHPSSTVGR